MRLTPERFSDHWSTAMPGLLTEARSPAVTVSPSPIMPSGLRNEAAACPLCAIEDAEPMGVGEDFEYRTCPDTFLAVRCRRCGIVYLNPRPAPSEMPRIYPDHYHAFEFQPEQFGFIYRVRRRLEANRLLQWCQGLPHDARILDVGCGDGFHLKLLQDYGPKSWTLEGVDTDDRAVSAARQAGVTIHAGQVEQLNLPPEAYDRIFMIMTIEHLNDPSIVLEAVHRLLKPGGRLIIVTDNTGSPDFGIFRGRHWGGYHFPRHTYLFHKSNLRQFVEKFRFQTVSVKTAMSPVNWVYSIRNWLDDWGAPRWLVRQFSLKSAPALALFTLWDLPLSWLGFGAILHGIFEKPQA